MNSYQSKYGKYNIFNITPHHPNLQCTACSHEKDNFNGFCNGVELILVIKLQDKAYLPS